MTDLLYHGTHSEFAYTLMVEGFRLKHVAGGRNFGHGVYLTHSLSYAQFFGDIVMRCELAPGIRFHRYADPDQRMIDRLRREFGSGITRPDFWKHVPAKKHLTKREFLELWNYFVRQSYLRNKRRVVLWDALMFRNMSRINQELRKHQVDGVVVAAGPREYWEWVVFDPSLVRPVSAHREEGSRDLGPPLPLERLREYEEAGGRAEWWLNHILGPEEAEK